MEKCIDCGSEFDSDREGTITIAGETICESCESSAWDYSSSVVVCEEEEIKTYSWCEHFGFRETKYWEEENPKGVDGFKYVKTDGWRGYWDVEVNENYVQYASGWSTGRWDDVSYKHNFNDLCDAIQSGNILAPVPVIFAFGLTSNVFSLSTDIILRKNDVEQFESWVELELGINPQNLKNSLH